MKPIESKAGLTEAVWDVIHDETNGEFTMKWLNERLPYGSRLRHVVCELCNSGNIARVGYGKYRLVK